MALTPDLEALIQALKTRRAQLRSERIAASLHIDEINARIGQQMAARADVEADIDDLDAAVAGVEGALRLLDSGWREYLPDEGRQ